MVVLVVLLYMLTTGHTSLIHWVFGHICNIVRRILQQAAGKNSIRPYKLDLYSYIKAPIDSSVMRLESSKMESSQICAVCQNVYSNNNIKERRELNAALTVSPPEANEIDCMGWCAIT